MESNIKNIQDNWNEITDFLKSEFEMSEVSYRTWIKPLSPYSLKNDIVTIVVNDEIIGSNSLDHIIKKYSENLKTSICAVMDHKYDISFVLKSQINEELKQSSVENDKEVKKERPKGDIYSSLNTTYTFDTFVTGPNNNMAHAAALAVAEAPGTSYNPLFIYGGVGLGKTHLMHSIANFVLDHNPDAKVAYVTSEKFTNELIEAIRNNGSKTSSATPTEFREKYRSVDVLLIDDIQFIIGKESTQEEFFHTFNTLYENKKQIVISSDKPPKDMITLEERLKSRFESGLTVDIQKPDYETRMAILRKKEDIDGHKIDDEVLKYIANNIKSNIRELEGALNKCTALSKLKKTEINLSLAEEALKDYISPDSNKKVITVQFIVDTVADKFKISPKDIVSTNRSRNIANPRQIAMYLCKKFTNLSVTDIGRQMNKDHSTVLHGINKIESELKSEPLLQNDIDQLSNIILPRENKSQNIN